MVWLHFKELLTHYSAPRPLGSGTEKPLKVPQSRHKTQSSNLDHQLSNLTNYLFIFGNIIK